MALISLKLLTEIDLFISYDVCEEVINMFINP